MAPDYTDAHVLLPFLARFMEQGTGYRIEASLVRDGSMRFDVDAAGEKLAILWTEHPREAEVQVEFSHGAVSAVERVSSGAETGVLARSACEHVANRIARLQRGSPPHLLLWRNRNLRTIRWGRQMFHRLCPGMLVKGKTRYFDYRVADIDEYEGLIHVLMESRTRAVRFRLTLTDLLDRPALRAWGPIGLVVCDDDRSEEDRASREHRVDEFLGYVLSRNLPPRFRLTFERDDPPAGYRPADFNVDLLRRNPPDDSSWFHMLFAASDDIAVVSSCDRECFNLFSYVASPAESWETIAPWSLPPSATLFRRVYQARMSGISTILGSDHADRCLDAVASSEHPPKLIVMIDSCLSRLVGEDTDGAVTRFQAAKDAAPLVFYDIKLVQEPYLGQVRSFWNNVVRELAAPVESPEPTQVCLLGIDPLVVPELGSILGESGVTVGGTLFPRLDPDVVRALPTNGLIVINNWHYTETIFADLPAQLDRPSLHLPLPYGFEGSQSWVDAIVAAVRVSDAPAVESVAEIHQLRDEFMAIRERIMGQRLAFVVRYRDGHEQFSARRRFGIPLIGVLRELGLAFDVNMFVDDEEEPDTVSFGDQLGLDAELGDSIGVFDHWSQLPELLSRGDFQLVYTETYRDERVTAAGKTPLGVFLLQPGFRGALATARTVETLLGSRFYTAYRRYFTDPFAHYRAGAREGRR